MLLACSPPAALAAVDVNPGGGYGGAGNWNGTAGDDQYTNNAGGTISGDIDMTQGGNDTVINSGVVTGDILGAGDSTIIINTGTVNGETVGSQNSAAGSSGGGNTITNSGVADGDLIGTKNSGDGASGGSNLITSSDSDYTTGETLIGTYNTGANTSGGSNTITLAASGKVGGVIGTLNDSTTASGGSNLLYVYGAVTHPTQYTDVIGSYNKRDGASGGDNTIYIFAGATVDYVDGSYNEGDNSTGGGNVIHNYATFNKDLLGSYNEGDNSSGGGNTIYNHASGTVQYILGSANEGVASSGGSNVIHNQGVVVHEIYGTYNGEDNSTGGGNTIYLYDGSSADYVYGSYNDGDNSTGGGNTIYLYEGSSAENVYGTYNDSDGSSGSGNLIHNYTNIRDDILGTYNAQDNTSGGNNTIYNHATGKADYLLGSANEGANTSGGGNLIWNNGTVRDSIHGSFNDGDPSSGGSNTIYNYGSVGDNIYGSYNSGDGASGGSNAIYNYGSVTNDLNGSINNGLNSSGSNNTIYNYGTVGDDLVGSFNSGNNATGGGHLIYNYGAVVDNLYGSYNDHSTNTATGNTIYNHGHVGGNLYSTYNKEAGATGGDDVVVNSGTVGGGIYTTDGNDQVTMQTGPESVGGVIDGGADFDTIVYSGGTWIQNHPKVQNFEDFQIIATHDLTLSGTWDASGKTVWVSGGSLHVPELLICDGLTIISGFADISGTVYTSNTYVGGLMRVNGVLNSDKVFISWSGTLSGSGTINGNLTIEGGLAPGNSVGALTVNGDVVFANSSNYSAELEAGGASDLLKVSGRVSINGGSITTSLPKALYANGTSWTIVSASQGVSGNFAAIVGLPASATLSLASLNNGNAINLEVLRKNFADFGETANQRAVGSGLDSAVPLAAAAGGGLADFLATVDFSYTSSQITALLGQLHPEMYDAFSAAGKANGEIFGQVMSQRAEMLHLARLLKAPGLAAGRGLVRLAASEVPTGGPVEDAPAGNWTVWARFMGGESYHRADPEHLGYDFQTSGAVIAGDGRALPWLTLGFSLGVTRSELDFGQGDHDGEQTGYHGGLYALAESGGLYLQAVLGYANYDNRADRPMVLADRSATAKASFDSRGLGGSLAAGYDFKSAGWVLGPLAGVSFSRLSEDAFAESGASYLNLALAERENDYASSSLGFRAARLIKAGPASWLPRLSLAWRRNLTPGARRITANPRGYSAASFTVSGLDQDRDLLAVSAGVSFFLAGRVTAYFDYLAWLGENASSHLFSAGLSWDF